VEITSLLELVLVLLGVLVVTTIANMHDRTSNLVAYVINVD
jgi:hypothetical protein